jgi:acyl-CoA synthetase (AMP-forming)/AMP-acid ligase II
MSGLPLIAAHAPDAPFCIHGGRRLRAGEFVAAALALAARLPDRGTVLLLCEDRAAFAVGFAGALLRRSTALLPSSRAPLAIERIVQSRLPACALVDSAAGASSLPEIVVDPWGAQPLLHEVPAIEGDHVAAIVHTSGTTGDPQPHAKTWSSLVRGADALRERVGFRIGSAIVGAVPPQHMWGLEATIMLAMQGGGIVHAGMPLLPADIAAALGDVAMSAGSRGIPA